MKQLTLPAFAGIVAMASILALAITFFVAPLAHAQAVPVDVTTTSTDTITADQATSLEAEIASIVAAVQSLESEINTLRASGQLGVSNSAGTCYMYTQDLAVGSSGNDVTALQNFLIGKGYLQIDAPTGYFGVLTQTALEQWQTSVGLAASSYGMVDANTRSTLNAPCAVTTLPPVNLTTTTSQTTVTGVPTISSISPGETAVGGEIMLTGTNLSPGDNTITVSGVNGGFTLTALPSSNGSLSFILPTSATSTSNAWCTPLTVSSTTACIGSGSYIVTESNGIGTSTGTSLTIQ